METANALNTAPEIWQVDVNGQIYETDLDELTKWIAEGALLPVDKVRRGNLRWLEANKVPLLYGFFNAKALGLELPKVSTTVNPPIQANIQSSSTGFSDSLNTVNNVANSANLQSPPTTVTAPALPAQNKAELPNPNSSSSSSCVIHDGVEPKFLCDTCSNLFCKECPSTYGSVKICPMCGAMCRPLAETIQKKQQAQLQHNNSSEGFGFSDFGKALVYPFKYKTSLIGGAILFLFFSLGQNAMAIGDIFLIVGAIFCFMLSNMLTFGILANTVENFSQGKINSNFMPAFEDFNLWDDVIHPFFLSIGVYISSFGPLIVVIFVMVFFVMSTTKPEIESLKEKAVATTAGETREDYSDISQTGQIKEITDRAKEISNQHNQQIEAVENNAANQNQPLPVNNEEQTFQELNNKINETRKHELESTIGKTPETEQAEYTQFTQKLAGAGLPFLLLVGIAGLWGIIYFPAACAVAGYTRSFGSTINPLVGLDTIKRLGTDYIKILGMFLLLGLISTVISGFLGMVFAPFNLPRMGNLPAIAVGSLFTFYFTIVFSVFIGFALYKNSRKLNLYQ